VKGTTLRALYIVYHRGGSEGRALRTALRLKEGDVTAVIEYVRGLKI
jgi:hypothetical protein